MDSTKQLTITKRQLKGLLVALVIEFILGVTLTTLVSYDPTKQSGLQTGILIAHVVVALGIVIGGVIRLVMSIKWHALQLPSTVGLLGALGALTSGGVAAGSGNNVAIFVMAMCFIIAFISYGYSLFALNKTKV